MSYRQDEGRSRISVSHQTKDALDSIKHTGQSYDRLLKELIRFWQHKRSEYWTRREIQEQKEEKDRLSLNIGYKGPSLFKREVENR